MKVKDLIKRLNRYDPDLEVVMSKDGEGNNFSPLADTEPCSYVADSTWSGELSDEGSINAVCLWPVN